MTVGGLERHRDRREAGGHPVPPAREGEGDQPEGGELQQHGIAVVGGSQQGPGGRGNAGKVGVSASVPAISQVQAAKASTPRPGSTRSGCAIGAAP